MEFINCEAYQFPPPGVDISTNELYHHAIKQHCDKVFSLINDPGNNFSLTLKAMNPATNSISFLAILVHIAENGGNLIPQDELAEHIVRLLVSYDPRQVRYGGASFMKFCTHLLSHHLTSTQISIETISRALLRLDPSGSYLTPAHVALVDAALEANDFTSPAFLELIEKDIIFYPGMHNACPKGTLISDMSLGPSIYLSHPGANLVGTMKPGDVLRYHNTCGLIQVARRDWGAAYNSFLRCAAHPSKDGGVSMIMTEAYRKLALVSLLHTGRPVKMPAFTSGSANKVYDIMGRPYNMFAAKFEAVDHQNRVEPELASSFLSDPATLSVAAELRRFAEANRPIWVEQQTLGLIEACLESYQRWKIMDLRSIYTTVTLSDIRELTQSAMTSKNLESEAEVESLIQRMIDEGEGSFKLHDMPSTTTGEESPKKYLEFVEEPPLNMKKFEAELMASALAAKELQPLVMAVDERVSTSKENIKQLVRTEKGLKKSGAGGQFGGSAGILAAAASGGGYAGAIDFAAANTMGGLDVDMDEDIMGDGGSW